MPTLLSGDESSDHRPFQQFYSFIRHNLNFYRLHIIYFTFTPLLFSGIFYASNGHFHIAYIDALFNSVSAMAVCGLASVDLSSLTGWQQTILFIQLCLGNPVCIVSYLIIKKAPTRARRMFTIHCENIVRAATRKTVQETSDDEEVNPLTVASRITSLFRAGANPLAFPVPPHGASSSRGNNSEIQGKPSRRLRTDMIRRVDGAPKLVDPSGWISEGQADSITVPERDTPNNCGSSPPAELHNQQLSLVQESRSPSPVPLGSDGPRGGFRKNGNVSFDKGICHSNIFREGRFSLSSRGKARPASTDCKLLDSRTSNADGERATHGPPVPRTQTIEFAPYPQTRHRVQLFSILITHHTKHDHFGGFPGPQDIISRLIRRFLPGVHRQLTRTVTMPRTTTITSIRGNTGRARGVPYISFDAVVGHNSTFERAGWCEFRALNALLWIVGIYHISVQLLSYAIIAPYISSNKWKNDFLPPRLHRPVTPAWFSLFQVVSAYTNAGMSLVDQSMIPFQTAFPMIFTMIFLILAGNTAFRLTIFSLRFSVWIITKLVPRNSRLKETLHFLLDHPRRCFIYLFPSHKLGFFSHTTDWFFFLILDLGNQAIVSIPVGVRVIDGMLQAAAVRAAGFAVVSLSALAPAVKVLYVIMMYISVCSVRSTNVYEERSLGVYEDDASIDEEAISLSGNRMSVWGNYLTLHARKQLAFDMWWLGLALFLVCIIERDQLENTANATWFNIFNIVFELVSAYGGVGLSLGVPYATYSFSGAFRPLSKLIVCLVMLRGRHRGLPVAIDRAVLLPFEYRQVQRGWG
ncbi:cation transport protein-domain-containing protein [Multifurca ochricompacta]|uniref:Cation transport protein-domain-containing protein n=1 Tax=Multifurca ochricompacta TaxID=376703 RepID=A0AAD4M4Z6_9AGAM|nr:cation transport protein-domain-containing protein [Multifurca ochricompacta]